MLKLYNLGPSRSAARRVTNKLRLTSRVELNPKKADIRNIALKNMLNHAKTNMTASQYTDLIEHLTNLHYDKYIESIKGGARKYRKRGNTRTRRNR